MLYRRPNGLKYGQMTEYVDNAIRTNDYDENALFEYLFLIVYALAWSDKMFNNKYDYDDFCVYSATRIFNKIRNPKQTKIDNISAFLVTSIRFLKYDFMRSDYYKGYIIKDEKYPVSYNFNSILYGGIDSIQLKDFQVTLMDISRTCKSFLKKLPYNTKSVLWLNLYTSVMLTFLNIVTVSKYDVRMYMYAKKHGLLNGDRLNKMVQLSFEDPNAGMLFRLDNKYYNLVVVLARQLRHIIAKELSESLKTEITDDFFLVGDYYMGDVIHLDGYKE
jgi:hypothetical protein